MKIAAPRSAGKPPRIVCKASSAPADPPIIITGIWGVRIDFSTASESSPYCEAPCMAKKQTSDSYVVVVGASAGGVDALQRLFRTLPANFPAPILVALHHSLSS